MSGSEHQTWVDTSSLRLPAGAVELATIETDAAPGFGGKKADGAAALDAMGAELADLQERLWAARTTGSHSRILLVLQGMDTSGKGGVIRSALGLVDPQGLQIKGFKAPSDEEKQHDFLWRIRNALPTPGHIGVFDRSHYEDVLIVRVHEWASATEIERRYEAINEFEAELAADQVTVIKCMLHVSAAEQQARLLARLENLDKHWKYHPSDVDERALWPAYQEAYQVALERTNTEAGPWHVIPADKKWYRNLAVAQLLLNALRGMQLSWPVADFDVEAEKRRLSELKLAELEVG